ncbi:MAG TPA: tripartite tricarboxylate transporter substrate binding protein [Xanthobacteraceae bacterium]
MRLFDYPPGIPGGSIGGIATMKLPRRHFLRLAAGASALPAISRMTWAQVYPSRPVRIVVGAPAGGGIDITARLIGQWLSERLGQQFVIENRPGGGGNIAVEAVVRAPADGHTLFLATPANAINATLYERLSFDFIRDIAPVGGLMRVPLVVVINPSLAIKTVRELIAYAKAHPGKVNMGLGGAGGVDHVAGALFRIETGADLTFVPYRGLAPALTDLMGGQIQVLFSSIAASIQYIKAGKLQALAVTSAVRADALPDLPTVGEFVPGVEATQWYGIVGPKGTPAAIVDRLNQAINAGLADPGLKARLAELGGMVLPGSPADFAKLLANETDKWGKVIRTAHIKPV